MASWLNSRDGFHAPANVVLSVDRFSGFFIFHGEGRRAAGHSRRGPDPAGRQLGDTWVAAWAADGAVYTPSDDTKGFHAAADSNVAFNKVTGDDVAET